MGKESPREEFVLYLFVVYISDSAVDSYASDVPRAAP